MKKHICIILLAALLLLCACQPTPSEPVVIQKDFDRMIEQAKASPAPEGTEPEQTQPDAQEREPAHVTESFTGRSEAFRVTIDADVIRPEGPLTIVRCKPSEFTAESAQPYFDTLTAGKDYYLRTELQSKAFLEEQIAAIQQELADGLPSLDRDGLSEEDIQDEYKSWERELDTLKKLWAKATDGPGTPVRRLSDVNWDEFPRHYGRILKTSDGQGEFNFRENGEAREGDRVIQYIQSEVWFYNRSREPDTDSHQWQRYADVTGKTGIPSGTDLKLTPAEAQAEAEMLIKEIGVSDMAVDRVYLMQENVLSEGKDGGTCINDKLPQDYAFRYLYEVRFCRTVNGIPVVKPTNFASSSNNSEDGGYAPSWEYEELYVCIGNDGVSKLYHLAPIETMETVVDDAALKPFSDILDIAKKMLPIMYEAKLSEPYSYREMEFQIDRITLCLERVAEKDNLNYGLLIPVWCFWGSDRHVDRNGSVGFNDIASVYGDPCGYLPLLVINAIDGSIIDPEKGY